ncbi:MAG: tetratricopeptide repeat protein [Candidatus Rifleibacteriota bacterium]
MVKKSGVLFLALFVLICQISFSQDDESLLERSQLLVQKGQKAEKRGDFDEAVASYEEAYKVYPKNILPLLYWGKSLYKVGMYERARELLARVPLNKIPDAGRSEVYLFLGRIALAQDDLQECAVNLSRSLKALESNEPAKIRLAMVNYLLSFSSRAEELLRDSSSFAGLSFNELIIAFLVDMQMGNFVRAFSTCSEFGNYMNPENYIDNNSPFLLNLWRIGPILFLTLLPVTLGAFWSTLYFIILFSTLLFFVRKLSAPTKIWHELAFVTGAVLFMSGARMLGQREFYLAAMTEQFSIYDSVWVLPRLLISGNLVALGLFIIFPIARMLPKELRPIRYEYFGIWFFCWFFMIFVLVFQSRLSFGFRISVMFASAFMAFLVSFCMPLGRFIQYKILSLFGYSGFAEVNRQDLNRGSALSFTDAKILETKAWKLLDKDDFNEVVLIARKVQTNFDKKTFPILWKAYIIALIAREDYIEAGKSIEGYLKQFSGSSLQEAGELFSAYLKSFTGDFAGALKLIRNISKEAISNFSTDETALSLLVLGRCDLFYKENVQAHIDLNKAFSFAKLPLFKAESLLELIELDYNMKSVDAVKKWYARTAQIRGGVKTEALKKVIDSIAAESRGDDEKALETAKTACETKLRISRACAWYGHLLCMKGDQSKAEDLLEKMTPNSAAADRLMTEVTSV